MSASTILDHHRDSGERPDVAKNKRSRVSRFLHRQLIGDVQEKNADGRRSAVRSRILAFGKTNRLRNRPGIFPICGAARVHVFGTPNPCCERRHTSRLEYRTTCTQNRW